MVTCTICHFAAELDDIAVRVGDTRCICLRCFTRATDTSLPMPKALRHDLIAALESVTTV